MVHLGVILLFNMNVVFQLQHIVSKMPDFGQENLVIIALRSFVWWCHMLLGNITDLWLLLIAYIGNIAILSLILKGMWHYMLSLTKFKLLNFEADIWAYIEIHSELQLVILLHGRKSNYKQILLYRGWRDNSAVRRGISRGKINKTFNSFNKSFIRNGAETNLTKSLLKLPLCRNK